MKEYKFKENEYPYGCPQCGNNEIERTDTNSYDNGVSEDWYCPKCDFEWREVFAFLAWEIIE